MTSSDIASKSKTKEKSKFDPELVTMYPKSSRKLTLQVQPYNLSNLEIHDITKEEKGLTTHISPFGLEFQIPNDYPKGTLLKICISIPDYWNRKRKFVDYGRIDSPKEFHILAKVVKTEEVGKRGRKKLVLAQTVNIDGIDEQVLKSWLQEAK
ncbi:MAG: hypothetical protein AB8C84_11370 [Oligoflexales bacterium]